MRMRRVTAASGRGSENPRGSDTARAGFLDRESLAAQRAILRIPGLDFEGREGKSRHTEVGASAAAVDDGAGRGDARAHGPQDFDDFAGAASGGDHVFHDYGGLAWLHRESAAEDHFAVGVAF